MLSQIQCSHGLFRTVFFLSICCFFAASVLDFCFLICLLTVNFMTKKPQCNRGRIFLLSTQELLLRANSMVCHLNAVMSLEDGAALMNHLRGKVQRTSSNPACPEAYTQICCGSACNQGHTGAAASALPLWTPREMCDGVAESGLL